MSSDVAWRRWQNLSQYLSRGGVAILDGATGTQIERLAGTEAMVSGAWSALSNLKHPKVVEAVHTSYLQAGADVIVANTYATNPNVMEAAGHGDKHRAATVEAVRIARRARDDYVRGLQPKPQVSRHHRVPLVAGSLSCHPPGMRDGAEYAGGETWPSPDMEEANYQRHAETLRSEGVDIIFLEMIWDVSHGARAVRAACSVDLPVFVSVCLPTPMRGEVPEQIRAQLNAGVDVKLGGLGTVSVRDAVSLFTDSPNVVGVNVHHTKLPFVLPTLRAVRDAGWTGPLGCYPDHGTFRHPHWEHEHLSARDLAEAAERWVEECGVQLVGGCCGVGPQHIREMSNRRDALSSRLRSWRMRTPPRAARRVSWAATPQSPANSSFPLPGRTSPVPRSKRSVRDVALLSSCLACMCIVMSLVPGLLQPGDVSVTPPPRTSGACDPNWARQWHRAMDEDGSGGISRLEWRRYLRDNEKLRQRLARRHRPLGRGDVLFDKLDLNQDQELSQAEFSEMWEKIVGAGTGPRHCVLPGEDPDDPGVSKGRRAPRPIPRAAGSPPAGAGGSMEIRIDRRPGQWPGFRFVGPLLTGVAPRSPAHRAGVAAGMRLQRVGNRTVLTQKDVEEAIRDARGPFTIVVTPPEPGTTGSPASPPLPPPQRNQRRGRQRSQRLLERVTQRGCACRQRWTVARPGKGANRLCVDSCCSFGEKEAWCFVRDKSCEGINWGVCAPPGAPRRPRQRRTLESARSEDPVQRETAAQNGT
eukprot:TRINITY_DN9633_c0_g2_i1.p1 TRINITY_DN9633_c0_g2~~TRINITY_DN9633_c0_g2_i1.p1  ORF type:complete len:754 (+),score=132.03 TRINITY_DN9633_c0_g2_i1:108-2369(+)